MTADGRAARNRTNAQKSTGPKTPAGKAAVAQNARRHGVTAKPDPASVAAWVRVILDDPDLTPAELLAEDDRMRRALSLAAAEVKFCEALASLDRFERGGEVPSEMTGEFQGFKQTIAEELAEPETTKREYRAGLSSLHRPGKVNSTETAPDGNQHRLLRRYLREARAQRRKAFQAWLACLEETQEIQEAA
jgi:hypothetical protein